MQADSENSDETVIMHRLTSLYIVYCIDVCPNKTYILQYLSAAEADRFLDYLLTERN